jgi:hypothetical protein
MMLRRNPLGSALTNLRLLELAGAAIVLAYFLRFAWGALWIGFAADDPMNLYYYWSRGPGELLRNLALFCSTYYRPMGGLYYLPIYHAFGLNPFPYHVVTISLLVLNTFLAYRFAALITGSRLAGGMSALLACYHVGLARLIYLPSFLFDVLCYTFYFLAFNYYLAIRTRGGRLRNWQVVAFLLLYIGALESKEMAVSLPVLVLLYEGLWHAPDRWSIRIWARWARSEALPALLAGVVTAVFLLGKTLGSDSPLNMEGYRPVFSVDRYFESTASFLNLLFYQPEGHGFFNTRTILLVAALLLAIAWRTGQKHLFLMFFFVIIAPLPITFLAGRTGPCLYIPLTGWAIFVGSVCVMFTEAVANSHAFKHVPVMVTQAALVLCAVAAQWQLSARTTAGLAPLLKIENQRTADVIRQIRSVQPVVRPGSTIYVMNDPFDGFDTQFLFELTYRDHSVTVWLDRHSHLEPSDIDRKDYVFTFENGRLKRLKGS